MASYGKFSPYLVLSSTNDYLTPTFDPDLPDYEFDTTTARKLLTQTVVEVGDTFPLTAFATIQFLYVQNLEDGEDVRVAWDSIDASALMSTVLAYGECLVLGTDVDPTDLTFTPLSNPGATAEVLIVVAGE